MFNSGWKTNQNLKEFREVWAQTEWLKTNREILLMQIKIPRFKEEAARLIFLLFGIH